MNLLGPSQRPSLGVVLRGRTRALRPYGGARGLRTHMPPESLPLGLLDAAGISVWFNMKLFVKVAGQHISDDSCTILLTPHVTSWASQKFKNI